MKTNIFIEGIAAETEKAIAVNALVSFNASTPKVRKIWMPKSLVANATEKMIEVEDWFLNKLSRENAFKGYEMRFETGVEI